jgi:cation-transporting P-type ATPase 13A2
VWRIPYPYRASTVFASFTVPTKANGIGASSINGEDFLLENLLIVDYRYARFALDPNSGLFNAVKYVK